MKILFLGLGSIGQRHLRNLKMLLKDENYEIISYRHSNVQYIIEYGKTTPCENLGDHYGFTELQSFEEAVEQKPDMSFICNPSSLHVRMALPLAKIRSALFIEKPLGTDLYLLNEFQRTLSRQKNITMVGFQSRFHPCIKEVKRIIQGKDFGNVISAQFNWSNYLPYFHPYEDYRQGYAARRDLGGGVTFTYCHELDLVQFLFGLPVSVYAVGGTLSQLEMDADDTIIALFKYQRESVFYPVSLHLTLAQGKEERGFTILMDQALIECDLMNSTLHIINQKKETIYSQEFKNISRNDLFLEEMRHFLDCVNENRETCLSVSEGKKSLFMSLAVHKSMETGHVELIA